MVGTLTTIALCLLVTAAVMWLYSKAEERSKRRDRAIIRRLQRYLDALPPARRW